MTTVDVFRDEKGRFLGFDLYGHADDEAVRGEDVVCAAISALAINTVNSLEVLAKADISCREGAEGGELSCRFNRLPDEKASLLVDSLLLGLDSVRKAYGGEYIDIRFIECEPAFSAGPDGPP